MLISNQIGESKRKKDKTWQNEKDVSVFCHRQMLPYFYQSLSMERERGVCDISLRSSGVVVVRTLSLGDLSAQIPLSLSLCHASEIKGGFFGFSLQSISIHVCLTPSPHLKPFSFSFCFCVFVCFLSLFLSTSSGYGPFPYSFLLVDTSTHRSFTVFLSCKSNLF